MVERPDGPVLEPIDLDSLATADANARRSALVATAGIGSQARPAKTTQRATAGLELQPWRAWHPRPPPPPGSSAPESAVSCSNSPLRCSVNSALNSATRTLVPLNSVLAVPNEPPAQPLTYRFRGAGTEYGSLEALCDRPSIHVREAVCAADGTSQHEFATTDVLNHLPQLDAIIKPKRSRHGSRKTQRLAAGEPIIRPWRPSAPRPSSSSHGASSTSAQPGQHSVTVPSTSHSLTDPGREAIPPLLVAPTSQVPSERSSQTLMFLGRALESWLSGPRLLFTHSSCTPQSLVLAPNPDLCAPKPAIAIASITIAARRPVASPSIARRETFDTDKTGDPRLSASSPPTQAWR